MNPQARGAIERPGVQCRPLTYPRRISRPAAFGLLLLLSTSTAAAATGICWPPPCPPVWTPTGLGVGGISALVVDPSEPATLYAAAGEVFQELRRRRELDIR